MLFIIITGIFKLTFEIKILNRKKACKIKMIPLDSTAFILCIIKYFPKKCSNLSSTAIFSFLSLFFANNASQYHRSFPSCTIYANICKQKCTQNTSIIHCNLMVVYEINCFWWISLNDICYPKFVEIFDK